MKKTTRNILIMLAVLVVLGGAAAAAATVRFHRFLESQIQFSHLVLLFICLYPPRCQGKLFGCFIFI